MDDNETRVHVKRNSKKKTGYEVELRSDGFYYGKRSDREHDSGVNSKRKD